MHAIEIAGLCKRYGNTCAVNNLSLTVEAGELLALLGLNGAGKTTTVRMLACLSVPDSGDARLFGESITRNTSAVKALIGMSPQESATAPNLSVYENLELVARLHGLSKKRTQEKIAELSRLFSLDTVMRKKSKTLSGGWQRRLSIAMALVSEPRVLFLDEPTLGLDVLARRELWRFIKGLKGKVTIILTTHYLEEAEALADRIAIMANGALRACGSAEELIACAEADNFDDAFVRLASGEVEI